MSRAAMKQALPERPILFSAPMVRAILAGTKTQTRRVVKPQPEWTEPATVWQQGDGHSGPGWYAHNEEYSEEGALHYRCPYGQPGDRLWVRETWAVPHRYDHLGPSNIPVLGVPTHYAATEDRGGMLWRPSIHMCRWASRITLEVTGVRVERLQAISEADAIAEGLHRNLDGLWSGGAWKHLRQPNRFSDPCNAFCDLWASINGPESWDANPWVWVVEFKRVEVQR